MEKYSYDDFFATLNKTGQIVLEAINEHIKSHYSAYKPLDIKPMNKEEKEWRIHYRKKPKVGKAICSLYSSENRLTVCFCLLSSMTHEFLLRQNEFSDKIRNNALKQIVCIVNKSCRNYGGNNICAWPQYYWINNRLIRTCHYPWLHFDDFNENDIADIKLLIDIQMRHMRQNPKEIKGSGYTEGNIEVCGEVKSINLDEINLDIDVFAIGDHVKKADRLDRYAKLYNLIPMGEKDGLWYYMSDESVRGMNREKNEYSHNEIPKGRYAAVVIEDPFNFSLNRVWNYICTWMQDNNEFVSGFVLNANDNTACLAKFFINGTKEFMAVYVPLK
jgi:effector-binding domain-containing protein